MKKKQKVKIIIGIVGIVLLLGLGYFFAFQKGKENVPKFGTKQPEEKRLNRKSRKVWISKRKIQGVMFRHLLTTMKSICLSYLHQSEMRYTGSLKLLRNREEKAVI